MNIILILYRACGNLFKPRSVYCGLSEAKNVDFHERAQISTACYTDMLIESHIEKKTNVKPHELWNGSC